MWQNIKNFIRLITRSSVDPVAMSLTVRGILIGVVAVVIQVAPIACALIAAACIDTAQLTPLVDAITNFVKVALELVAGGMIVVGLIRKIWVGRMIHPEAGIQ